MASNFEWTKLFVDTITWTLSNLRIVLPVLALVIGGTGYSLWDSSDPVVEKSPVSVENKTSEAPKTVYLKGDTVYITKPVETKVETKTVETLIMVDEEYKIAISKRIDELEKRVDNFDQHIRDYEKHNKFFH